MKIFVTGTRGIPDIPGGVEKHCQELYPRIVQKGHKVTLATRSPYVKNSYSCWNGVDLVKCFAPKSKSIEALVHTLLSIFAARDLKPDIVHIHAVGPSLVTPVSKMLGFRTVVTNHGPEYDRLKWGKIAKLVLKLAERLGTKYANEVIAVSSVARKILYERYNKCANIIHNGVTIPEPKLSHYYLKKIGVEPQKYFLSVARLVPEKGLHDLINAFKRFDSNLKLVIAGDADHETTYSRALRQSAKEDPRIILTGYITGEPLNQIYSNAALFVLPSYHEGLPIVLLEAMSYGLLTLASDIPANKEIGFSDEFYFKCGNIDDLQNKIKILLNRKNSEEDKEAIRNKVIKKYDWDKIADQTIGVYKKALAIS
jgi:glycosyltransferase involved in cell wall biosynthesis